MRRIFFPSIEKGPHKNEWLWKARWHQDISKGPPSTVLLWPQADGLGNHVWHLPWGAFSAAPEQVWVTLWEAEPRPESAGCVWWRWIFCGLDLVPLCFHTSILVPAIPHQYLNICHCGWSGWGWWSTWKYWHVMGRNVFIKNVYSTVLRAPGEAHLLGVSSAS